MTSASYALARHVIFFHQEHKPSMLNFIRGILRGDFFIRGIYPLCPTTRHAFGRNCHSIYTTLMSITNTMAKTTFLDNIRNYKRYGNWVRKNFVHLLYLLSFYEFKNIDDISTWNIYYSQWLFSRQRP